jgi:hypothetical protein
MPQFSDDLYLGPAVGGGVSDGSSPMTVGVGPMGRVYVWDIAPLTLQAAGLAASQNPGSGASFTLTAGTGVTTTTNGNGVTRYILDCARTVTITAAGANTATYTITGYDLYGQLMTETVAAPSTSTVSSAKMFKSVVSVTNANATASTNGVTVGYGDIVGLPYRVTTRDYVYFNYNATVGLLAAITVADTTSPATATTGDVRGKITLASAADGTKRLVAFIGLPALASGPNATRIGAFGVTQA